VPPKTTLAWHEHPMPNAAYMLSGELTVEKKSDGKTRHLKAGDTLPEMVDIIHRGYTGEQEAQLIVFYAGNIEQPLSIPEKK
jgi:quercetin dioxygenase-like cupin family protein